MTTETEPHIPFSRFLESIAPGRMAQLTDLGFEQYASGATKMKQAEITTHCDSPACGGPRLFRTTTDVIFKGPTPELAFLKYVCKNCSLKSKVFAVLLKLDADRKSGQAMKYGEFPAFGPPTPARLISLIGPQKELFLKGRSSENQGLGIAAFAYYRRVIEDQKDRIFDEIIKVCQRLSVENVLIEDLQRAKAETQFSKGVEAMKYGIPQALLTNGQNPLLLLHSALSEGLHAQSDEECLEIATSIRIVLVDFVDKVAQALKNEAELNSAVARLLNRKTLTK